MKIAILTSTFPPYAGGIGNVAAANALELSSLGHEVTIFTPLYEQVKEEVTQVDVVRIKPLISYGNAAYIPSVVNQLKGYDIIHVHYPFFGGAESLLFHKNRVKKKFKAKIVLHYHMDVVGEGIFKTFFNFHRKFILPKIVKMSDKIIFTSLDYGQESYLKNYLVKDKDKFIEVPNGVDTKRFTPKDQDENLLAKHDISKTDKIVLFVGGLDKAHYFKGVEYLIEAMSKLRNSDYDWKLLIVGEGELQSEYQSFADQLRLSNHTVFTGYVSNKDLPSYYNLADVVVLPSVDRSEAFGLALVEAMACAKPVIGSNLPGVRSVIEDEVNGLLINPEDSSDLATKINFILENPAIADGYGVAGRQKAEQIYDWISIATKLNTIYKEL